MFPRLRVRPRRFAIIASFALKKPSQGPSLRKNSKRNQALRTPRFFNSNEGTAPHVQPGREGAARKFSSSRTACRRTESGPIRQNLFRRHDLLRCTGKMVLEFSGPVGDMNLDGFEATILHPQAELFVDFLDPVLLEAIAHAQPSGRDR